MTKKRFERIDFSEILNCSQACIELASENDCKICLDSANKEKNKRVKK